MNDVCCIFILLFHFRKTRSAVQYCGQNKPKDLDTLLVVFDQLYNIVAKTSQKILTHSCVCLISCTISWPKQTKRSYLTLGCIRSPVQYCGQNKPKDLDTLGCVRSAIHSCVQNKPKDLDTLGCVRSAVHCCGQNKPKDLDTLLDLFDQLYNTATKTNQKILSHSRVYSITCTILWPKQAKRS